MNASRVPRFGLAGVSLIVMAWLILLAVVMRDDGVVAAIATERDEATQLLGPTLADELAERGRRWSDAILVDSGLLGGCYTLFTVPAAERANDGDFGAAVPWFTDGFERRLAVLFAFAGQVLQRVSFGVPWIPAVLLLVLPSTLDGLMLRQIRRCTFDYCSPLLYRGGIVAIELILLAMLLSLLAPWPQPVWLIPLLLVAIAPAAAVVAANVQKEL